MKWRRLIFSAITLLPAMHMTASDSIAIEQDHVESRYEQRLQRIQNTWASLVPTHFVIQNAGSAAEADAAQQGYKDQNCHTCKTSSCPVLYHK